MRMPACRRLLFVLALVLSQWLVVAHAASHPALALDLNCEICLHAHGNHGALPSAGAALPPLPDLAAPPQPLPAAGLRAAAPFRQPIRGPPRTSV